MVIVCDCCQLIISGGLHVLTEIGTATRTRAVDANRERRRRSHELWQGALRVLMGSMLLTVTSVTMRGASGQGALIIPDPTL